MTKIGESSCLKDEEFRSVPIVCDESPIAKRVVIAVEPIPLVKKKESAFEKRVDELKEELGGSLLDDLLDQNIKLESKVNALEERIHDLEVQAVEYPKESGVGLMKESDNQELIQAWAKIQELEATIRDLQSEKSIEVKENKKPNEQKRKMDNCKPNDNKLKRKKDSCMPKGIKLKKTKVEKCVNCRKSHSGVCLKGKGVCYECGQSGHIAPNCVQSKKKRGCFHCGAADHQMKKCLKKGTFEDQSELTP